MGKANKILLVIVAVIVAIIAIWLITRKAKGQPPGGDTNYIEVTPHNEQVVRVRYWNQRLSQIHESGVNADPGTFEFVMGLWLSWGDINQFQHDSAIVQFKEI